MLNFHFIEGYTCNSIRHYTGSIQYLLCARTVLVLRIEWAPTWSQAISVRWNLIVTEEWKYSNNKAKLEIWSRYMYIERGVVTSWQGRFYDVLVSFVKMRAGVKWVCRIIFIVHFVLKFCHVYIFARLFLLCSFFSLKPICSDMTLENVRLKTFRYQILRYGVFIIQVPSFSSSLLLKCFVRCYCFWMSPPENE